MRIDRFRRLRPQVAVTRVGNGNISSRYENVKQPLDDLRVTSIRAHIEGGRKRATDPLERPFPKQRVLTPFSEPPSDVRAPRKRGPDTLVRVAVLKWVQRCH